MYETAQILYVQFIFLFASFFRPLEPVRALLYARDDMRKPAHVVPRGPPRASQPARRSTSGIFVVRVVTLRS